MPGSLGSYKAELGGGGPWRVHSLIVGFKMAQAMGHTGPGSCQRAMYSESRSPKSFCSLSRQEMGTSPSASTAGDKGKAV